LVQAIGRVNTGATRLPGDGVQIIAARAEDDLAGGVVVEDGEQIMRGTGEVLGKAVEPLDVVLQVLGRARAVAIQMISAAAPVAPVYSRGRRSRPLSLKTKHRCLPLVNLSPVMPGVSRSRSPDALTYLQCGRGY
jgi:hypothetical protein